MSCVDGSRWRNLGTSHRIGRFGGRTEVDRPLTAKRVRSGWKTTVRVKQPGGSNSSPFDWLLRKIKYKFSL